MFRNYLIIALRNIVRHKLYSFINIAGLAIGLACVIFVILFIQDELSYDKWIPDTQNLYRVEVAIYAAGRDPIASATVPFPMTGAMRDGIRAEVARELLDEFRGAHRTPVGMARARGRERDVEPRPAAPPLLRRMPLGVRTGDLERPALVADDDRVAPVADRSPAVYAR